MIALPTDLLVIQKDCLDFGNLHSILTIYIQTLVEFNYQLPQSSSSNSYEF